MTKQYATKSWIYAVSVWALFLFLLAITSPAQAESHYDIYGSTTYQPTEKMQLARGDAVRPTPQRRTYVIAEASEQTSTEPGKEMIRDKKGVQGPAGKTPAENGPQGKSQAQQNDAFRVPGDITDGCSKYLRCSGD